MNSTSKTILLSLPLVLALAIDCSPAGKQDARDALDATLDAKQLACVFSSTIIDAPALAKACEVADRVLPILLPVIRGLIGQREGARRAGVVWQNPISDAGISDAAKE